MKRLLMCLLLAGCVEEKVDPTQPPRLEHYKSGLVDPQVYNPHLLYFPVCYASFAWSLSKWMSQNPTERIVTIAPDDTGPEGSTEGYFVVVEER